MILAGTSLLYPTRISTQTIQIPREAKLAGLAYDYRRGCLWVGANPAHRVYGLSPSTGLIQRSILLPANVIQIVDLVCNGDLLHVLHYTGSGQMEILVGIIDNEDWEVFSPSVYQLPYHDMSASLPNTETIWTYTHNSSLEFLRYHPRYTSMFNVASSLYLVPGLSKDVVNTAPPELGQWLVSYDLLGFMGARFQMDNSTWAGGRVATNDDLNGLAVAATYVDGNILAVCESFGCPSHVKVLTVSGDVLTWKGLDWLTAAVDNSENVSITSDSRYVYLATDDMIYKSKAQFLIVYASLFDMYSPCVDAGVVAQGQSLTRELKIKNISTTHKYDRITITSAFNELTLSKDNSNFEPQITIYPNPVLSPDSELSFYVRITPNLTAEDLIQFIRCITVTGRECP